MAMMLLIRNKLLFRSAQLTYKKGEVKHMIYLISQVLEPSKSVERLFLSQTFSLASGPQTDFDIAAETHLFFHLKAMYLETQKRVTKNSGPIQDC